MPLKHEEEEAYEALKAALRAIQHARKLCEHAGWIGTEVVLTLEESRSNMQYTFNLIRQSVPWVPKYEADKAAKR